MSTIAWDGYTLAADKQATSGNLKAKCSKMLSLNDGTVLATAGSLAEGYSLFDWYVEGADRDMYPGFQNDSERWTSLIVALPNGKCFEFEQAYHPLPVKGKSAWGSGRSYALAAMEMGADAVKAVKVASKFDPSTGLGIESYIVKDKNEKIK